MVDLSDTSTAELRAALAEVEASTPTLRIVAAIAVKEGVSQTTLASWFGVERKTIYNWLSRFEDGDPVTAARDADRPGRPRKLDSRDRERLAATLADPPSAHGYEDESWTPRLVQDLLDHRFDVAYSRSSCRRLQAELASDLSDH